MAKRTSRRLFHIPFKTELLLKNFMILLLLIVVFSLLYHIIEEWDLVTSVYSSTMIQTLVGISWTPKKTISFVLMSLQALLSFVLVTHTLSIIV